MTRSSSLRLEQRLSAIGAAKDAVKDWWRWLGLLGSALSVLSLTKHYFQIDLNGILARAIDTYRQVIREPILNLLMWIDFRPPPFVVDFFLLYLLIGGVVARAFSGFAGYGGGTPVAGSWGRLIRNPLFPRVNWLESQPWRTFFYLLATLFWPLLALEYFFRSRYVFVGYMDSGDSPNWDSIATVFTSAKRDLREIVDGDWNKTVATTTDFGHDRKSDFWYKYSGDLQRVLLVNAAIAVFVVGLFFAFNALPIDIFW